MVTGTAALQTILNYNSWWIWVSALTSVDISIARCRVTVSLQIIMLWRKQMKSYVNIFISQFSIKSENQQIPFTGT